MFYIFSILIVITAVLIVLIVLVQNSKGGGLVSNFSSSNQVLGVRKTTDFLEKATWILAIALLVFSIGASMTIERNVAEDSNKMYIDEQVENTADPSKVQNIPSIPAAQPAAPTGNTAKPE